MSQAKKGRAKLQALGTDPFKQKPTSPVTENVPQQEETIKETSPEQKESSTKRLLQQLGEELDQFHLDPSSYDRKRLEELVKEFLHELKSTLSDSGHFYRIREAFNDKFDFWEMLKKVRSLLKSDEV